MSPIKGLTDQGAAFPRIGVLRKGGEKPEKGPGRDLTYFRFTSEYPEVVEVFQSAYGEEPTAINVFLPYPTAAENFPAWREHWVAGGLVHRCDGETCVLSRQEDGSYSHEPKPCPGECKPAGRLSVIIPELRRLAFVTALTGSLHDIMELTANLEGLEMLRGDLRGIPLVLRRSPRKISTPAANGKRVRREKWLLSIEAADEWVALQLEASKAAAMPQLTAPDDDNGWEPPAILVDGTTGEILSRPDNGPDWDGVPDEDEPPFDIPPDFLTVQVPKGDHAGKTIGWLLDNDLEYVRLIATNARDKGLRESANAALEWFAKIQEELPL